MSGPASKLFPPGFFADTHSLDSNRSPNQKSCIENSGGEIVGTTQANRSFRSNRLLKNEIFSQMSVASQNANLTLSPDSHIDITRKYS